MKHGANRRSVSSKTSAAVAEKTAGKQEQQLSSARNTPIVRAAKKVGPAVVGITNKGYVRDFFNRVYFTDKGTGSGVIYDKAGYIATINAVVEGCINIDGVDYVIKRTLSRPALDKRTSKSKTTQKVEYYKVFGR